jgi:hypothetical protein
MLVVIRDRYLVDLVLIPEVYLQGSKCVSESSRVDSVVLVNYRLQDVHRNSRMTRSLSCNLGPEMGERQLSNAYSSGFNFC